jgi:hypothetical protein
MIGFLAAVLWPLRFCEDQRFNSSAISLGFMVISTHAGRKPLFTAFFTERMFDHAEQ